MNAAAAAVAKVADPIERFTVPAEMKRLFDAAAPYMQTALDVEYQNGVYDIVQDVLTPGEDAVLIVRLHTHSDVAGCSRLLESAYAAMPEDVRLVRRYVRVWPPTRDYVALHTTMRSAKVSTWLDSAWTKIVRCFS